MTDCSTPDAHEAFAKTVADDIARLEAELHELRAVQTFHLRHAAALRIAKFISANGCPLPNIRADEVQNMKHHEAAAVALRAFGRRARTVEIAKVLREAGYGKLLKNTAFQTILSIAMKRNPDIFRKIGYGEWILVEWEKMTATLDAGEVPA